MSEDRRIELRISEELLGEIDRVRGLVPRGAWVKKACRVALEGQGSGLRRAAAEEAVRRAGQQQQVPPRVVPSLRDTWSR